MDEDTIDPSVLNDEIELYGGGEDEKTVTSLKAVTQLSEDGYYPASLEYVLRNYRIDVSYADGTESSTYGWYGQSGSEFYEGGYYSAYTAYAELYMYFYDKNGEQVKIDNTIVPSGTYEIRIFANSEGTGEPLLSGIELKVLDPTALIRTTNGNQASFASEDSNKYEEIWYKIPTDLNGTYIYNPKNWIVEQHFIGIWKYSNGIATQINDGNSYYDGTTGKAFRQVLDGTNENLYLVMGETYASGTISGTVSWQQQKEIRSLELNTAASYLVWNNDIAEKTSAIVGYTDGTTESVTDWKSSWTFKINDDDKWIDGYKATSQNGDTICLGMVDSKGNLVDAYGYDEWIIGETSWKVWMEEKPDVSVSGSMTIAAPPVKNITLTKGKLENFTISKNNAVYYQFSVENEAQIIETVNSSTESMSMNIYRRKANTEKWHYKMGVFLDASRSEKEQFDVDYEYLVILYTDTAAEGTFGLYVTGKTKSAAASALTANPSGCRTWLSLPITVTFVDENGTAEIGTQIIKNWSISSYKKQQTLYAKTKYNEKIHGVLYKGDVQVSFPVFGEEDKEELAANYGVDISDMSEEELEAVWEELGIKFQPPLAPGVYTLKFYLATIADENLIGDTTVTVVNTSGGNAGTGNNNGTNTGMGDNNNTSGSAICTSHKWNSGRIIKEATCTSTGLKICTCTNSGCTQTKEETIPMKSHDYSEWTTKTAATVFAPEVQQLWMDRNTQLWFKADS